MLQASTMLQAIFFAAATASVMSYKERQNEIGLAASKPTWDSTEQFWPIRPQARTMTTSKNATLSTVWTKVIKDNSSQQHTSDVSTANPMMNETAKTIEMDDSQTTTTNHETIFTIDKSTKMEPTGGENVPEKTAIATQETTDITTRTSIIRSTTGATTSFATTTGKAATSEPFATEQPSSTANEQSTTIETTDAELKTTEPQTEDRSTSTAESETSFATIIQNSSTSVTFATEQPSSTANEQSTTIETTDAELKTTVPQTEESSTSTAELETSFATIIQNSTTSVTFATEQPSSTANEQSTTIETTDAELKTTEPQTEDRSTSTAESETSVATVIRNSTTSVTFATEQPFSTANEQSTTVETADAELKTTEPQTEDRSTSTAESETSFATTANKTTTSGRSTTVEPAGVTLSSDWLTSPSDLTSAPVDANLNVERSCDCSPFKMYLDVVAVVDSSSSMTLEGLFEAAADLATLFQSMTIALGPEPGQFVRVALVTFSGHAVTAGDLRTFGNYSSLVDALFRMPFHGDSAIDIIKALQTASSILEDSRKYVRTVVLLYSSAYSAGGFTDPTAIANQLKESGTTIVTVAFRQHPEGLLVEKLRSIASPHFAFNSMDSDIIGELLHAFCRVNCYCKNNWVQYADALFDKRSLRGECLRFGDIDASWFAADLACRAMATGAHLANEFSEAKHNFVHQYASYVMKDVPSWSKKYHVGLHFNPSKKAYYWQGPNRAEIPMKPDDYHSWMPGYPDLRDGSCVSVVPQKSAAGGEATGVLQSEDCVREAARYICQVPSCDTANFCSSFED
uniref:C-type lectin n=1 Tax=Parascaris univalens TaxID=6257 RepID=A0A915AG65_PARUN